MPDQRNLVQIGGTYQHKSSGKFFVVKDYAAHAIPGEYEDLFIIFYEIDDPSYLWCRIVEKFVKYYAKM